MRKKIPNSIRIINHVIIFFLIYINSLYLVIQIPEYHLHINIINIVILIIFIFVNKIFDKEAYNGKQYMREIIGTTGCNANQEHIRGLLFKKLTYTENDEFYKLFKKIYIKRNIIEKDYNDLKDLLLKFIPEGFINEVGESGIEKITPGISIKKHLNVMFLDIIGFTSITEKFPPERALMLLNIYFDGIVEIIKTNDGYIDKFLGDGMMIIFDGTNSDNAIKSAIEIQNYIKKFQINEVGKKISIGIGINSGEVILGTIGSKKRMEITIIGDTVNTASRIEGLTRTSRQNILISESTYNSLENNKVFTIDEIGLKKLRGKKDKIKLFGVESHINLNI